MPGLLQNTSSKRIDKNDRLLACCSCPTIFTGSGVVDRITPCGSYRGSTPTLYCAERRHEDLRNRLPSLLPSRDRTLCRCRRQSGLTFYHKNIHSGSRGSGHCNKRRFDHNDNINFASCPIFIIIFIVHPDHSHRQRDQRSCSQQWCCY